MSPPPRCTAIARSYGVRGVARRGRGLRRAAGSGGVETEAVRFDGLVHGVYWMSGAVPRSRELHDTVVAFLAKRLAHRPTRTG